MLKAYSSFNCSGAYAWAVKRVSRDPHVPYVDFTRFYETENEALAALASEKSLSQQDRDRLDSAMSVCRVLVIEAPARE